jgi:hypothetical protein
MLNASRRSSSGAKSAEGVRNGELAKKAGVNSNGVAKDGLEVLELVELGELTGVPLLVEATML